MKNHPGLRPASQFSDQALQGITALLQGRSIFLTGGTGFFGKWLLHSYARMRAGFGLKASLTVLSRDPGQFLRANPEFRDVVDLDFLPGDVRACPVPAGRGFDTLIHGATATSAAMNRETCDIGSSVSVAGTRRVLELARACGATRLLYVSSGAVYGVQPPDLEQVAEDYAGQPTSAYGRAKMISEQLCLDAADGRFDCIIARPFAFVGPYLPLDTTFAVGNFIGDCLLNRPISIQGDGRPMRSYLYAAELAEWLWTILLRGKHGQAYNVGSGAAVSIHDLALLVRACAGSGNEIVVKDARTPGTLPPRYVPAVDKARRELGLAERGTLAEAIRRTLAWHRENNRGSR